MYIGIDIGGTNARIAGSKSLNNIVLEKTVRFELSHDFETDFKKIIESIELINKSEIQSIAIGTPGTYSEDKKTIISANPIPEWVSQSFVEKLSKKFGCPVLADNDAVIASLGEAEYGHGKSKNYIYITWGTGTGGALVKNKNGEADSQKINWHLYLKDFEEKCGGKNIMKKYGRIASDLDEVEWSKIMNDMEFLLEDISEKLREKNIIMGGGMTARQKIRIEEMANGLKLKDINLMSSIFRDDVGLYGAFALIKSKIPSGRPVDD